MNPTREDYRVTFNWLVFGGIFLLVLIPSCILLSFLFGWIGAPARIFGADNVSRQYTLAYDNYASLQGTADNYCRSQTLVKQATPGTSTYDQLVAKPFAYSSNYNRIAADYNAAMNNIFQAKAVRPSDLPEIAPTLEQMMVTRQACR